jgi:hypothetical protein
MSAAACALLGIAVRLSRAVWYSALPSHATSRSAASRLSVLRGITTPSQGASSPTGTEGSTMWNWKKSIAARFAVSWRTKSPMSAKPALLLLSRCAMSIQSSSRARAGGGGRMAAELLPQREDGLDTRVRHRHCPGRELRVELAVQR